MKRVYFCYGLDRMFLVGIKFEWQGVMVALGPLYLEWYW